MKIDLFPKGTQEITTLVTGLPGLWLTWAAYRAGRVDARAARGEGARLDSAADHLAAQVLQQWERTARDRKLYSPAPIPVRWRWSRHAATGPMEAALGNTGGLPPFHPVPGFQSIEVSALRTGGMSDLLKVHGGLTSGRVIVLGRPGSGKSEAGLLAVLEMLRHRRDASEGRSRIPVPVLLNMTGWDGRYQSLTEWAAAHLSQDYPFLRLPEYGSRAAARLIEQGQISFFLDGFDELAVELRPIALERISEHSASRVVLFSRVDEFMGTVPHAHIRGAAALELDPIPSREAAEYLRRTQVSPAPRPWQELIAHLRDHPESVLSHALDSPLPLTLVRDSFPNPEDVSELLTVDRFFSTDDVVTYLLDRFVNTVYQPKRFAAPGPYEHGRARGWLRYLASEMAQHGTYSFDWRRLPHWAPALPRILMLGSLSTAFGAIGGLLAFGPGQYSAQGISGAQGGVVYGVVMGLVLGLGAGMIAELRDPGPNDFRQRFLRRRNSWSINFNPGVGIVVGTLIGFWSTEFLFSKGNYFGEPKIALFVISFLVVGVGSGALSARAAMRVHPHAGRGWRARARSWYSRLPLFAGAMAGGIPIGLRYLFQVNPPAPLSGLLNGIWGMLIAALVIGAARPASRIDPLVGRDAAWRRERRGALLFGVVFGLCVGLGFGIREITMYAHGVVGGPAVVVALSQTVGLALPFGVGAMIASSDAWRSTFFFLQLRLAGSFPARGMQFLEDAYARRVLRADGPRYQFRHALLQDTLQPDRLRQR
ncbi:NACHT domain-containing protein [Streptomyces sp. NPDC057654]|uniref:NACHT domain-containing protein n=1 Tax=Streptomyces sp. NPDC057654 TaxID=3346196 RepID=UPI0036CEFF82